MNFGLFGRPANIVSEEQIEQLRERGMNWTTIAATDLGKPHISICPMRNVNPFLTRVGGGGGNGFSFASFN